MLLAVQVMATLLARDKGEGDSKAPRWRVWMAWGGHRLRLARLGSYYSLPNAQGTKREWNLKT